MPAGCWEHTDLPLVYQWFIDHLRESQTDPSRTRDEGTVE